MEKISDVKLFHMRAVAELMYSRALELYGDEAYAEDMFLLGFLHDIGYIYGSESHGDNGAALLERNGYRHSEAVRCHGKTEWVSDESDDERFLLQWCDMSVKPGGIRVSCEERLHDVGDRYGFDSDTYRETELIRQRLAERGLF